MAALTAQLVPTALTGMLLPGILWWIGTIERRRSYTPAGGGERPEESGYGREEKRLRFKAIYPGAFVYHCAPADVDYHIASGMFGLSSWNPRRGSRWSPRVRLREE